MVILTMVNVLLCLANIGVFALSLKVYTELMKDKNMSARSNSSKIGG